MIQNRLKTIVLFHAPVICADVIPGVGTLPKTQDLHYALLHWRNILFQFFFLRRKEGIENKYIHVALTLSTKSVKTDLVYYDNLVNASLSSNGCHPNLSASFCTQ